MVAFKSRRSAALDLPVCLEEDACFEGAGCFETIVCFEAVAYFEAAACCETAFDAAEVEAFDAAEAEAFNITDADNADGSNVEPPNERDKPWADAKLWDKTDTEEDAETATVFACAATAPNDAAPTPTAPASEAATNRNDLDRTGERSRTPRRPLPRFGAPPDSPSWNHVFVVFLELLIPPVSRNPHSNNIPPPGQYTSMTGPTSMMKIARRLFWQPNILIIRALLATRLHSHPKHIGNPSNR
jgi:hypothetical protein